MTDERQAGLRVLPDDTVCACLDETGERKVALYERCLRCDALMAPAQVPAQEERARLRLIETEARDFIELHDAEDGVDPTWPCTGQCIQARGLRRALGVETKEEGADHEHYWVDAADDETGWHCTICGVTEYPEPPFGAESVGVEGAGRE